MGTKVKAKLVAEELETGWSVVGVKGQRRAIIATGLDDQEHAEAVANRLTKHGYVRNGTRGVLMLPAGWEEVVEGLPRLQGRGTVSIPGGRAAKENNTKDNKVAKTNTKDEVAAEVHDITEGKAKKEKAPKKEKAAKPTGDQAALAQQVYELREATGKSWAVIGKEIEGVGTPNKARKLWSLHAGKPHTEAREVARANASPGGSKKGKKKGAPEIDLSTVEPIFANEATDAEVLEVVQEGKTLTWLRTDKKSTDSATVKEVRHITTSGKGGFKTLSFTEAGTNATRNCRIENIVHVS